MTELIGIEEAAKMCGNQSISTMRWWKAQGTGPKSVKVGRRVMYRRDDIESWIDSLFAA